MCWLSVVFVAIEDQLRLILSDLFGGMRLFHFNILINVQVLLVTNYMVSFWEDTMRCWEEGIFFCFRVKCSLSIYVKSIWFITSVSLLCLCVVCVSMICPLMRVECWSFALLLYGVHYVLWALVEYLLWMWVPLHLEHRCSELRVLLGRFFSFDEYEVCFFIFFDNFWLKAEFIRY